MSPLLRGPAGAAPVLLGLFVSLQVLVALVRGDPHVLLGWVGGPWAFVVLAWVWVLVRAGLAGLAALGLGALVVPALEPERPPERVAATVAGVALLTAVGLGLRFVAPVSIPPGVWVDSLLEAKSLLRDPGGVPWLGGSPLPHATAHEMVSHLLLRSYDLLFRLLGRGDAGILSLSAVPGALAVPAAGWLAWEAFGGRAAVLAASFLAFSSRALALSRWGYTPATLVPLALAAVAAALAARRRRSTALAALSGLFAGLAMHTHSSAIVVPVAVACWIVGTWGEPGFRRRAAATAGAALFAAAPWLLGFLQHPGYVGGRLRDVHVANPVRDVHARDLGLAGRLASNAVDYSGLFMFTFDPNPRHGFPGRPAGPAFVGAATLLGYAALGSRFLRDRGAPRALLWLSAGSLAAGVLSDPGAAPNTVRVCILLASGLTIGAGVLAGLVERLATRLGSRTGPVLALVATSFFVSETVPFLSVWPDLAGVRIHFCPNESAAGRTLRRLGTAPVVLERRSVEHPLVLETLAAPPDPRGPVPAIPTATPAELLATVPPAPSFWVVASRRFAGPLVAAGWAVSRPVPVGPGAAVVVFRVRPPAPPPGPGPGRSGGAPAATSPPRPRPA